MKLVFMNDGIYAYAMQAPSAVGGAERQQWLLGHALAAQGWSVTVGVRQALNIGERRNIAGVEFVGIGRDNILLAWYRFLAAVRPHWWYWRCADHLWGAAVEIAKRINVRTIFSAAYDTDVQPRHALDRRPRWWLLYAWGLARTDRIFLQHHGQLSALAARWRSKAHIVPSIVGEKSASTPHAERTRSVAWVGQLRQPKRPDRLVEIARNLPSIRFAVCGSPTSFMSPLGYGERIVEALHKLPNVEYCGQVEPDRARHIMADAAVLLSTSEGEGFPNTFLQAWASGTPVISISIDPGQIITHNGLGAVCGSVDKAIAHINALLESVQQREEIAIRARRYVEENHSTAAVMQIFHQAIGGVLT